MLLCPPRLKISSLAWSLAAAVGATLLMAFATTVSAEPTRTSRQTTLSKAKGRMHRGFRHRSHKKLNRRALRRQAMHDRWVRHKAAMKLPACEPGRVGACLLMYTDPLGDPKKQLPVHVWVPQGATTDTPILFSMHGRGRNAHDFRDAWVPMAEQYGVIVAAPEFNKQTYPRRAQYNAGNVGRGARKKDRSEWGFTVVDHLFDHIKDLFANRSERYFLFGHSAGGQFVQRMVTLVPDRIEVAVAANAGDYTAPVLGRAYPRGVHGLGMTSHNIRRSLETPLVIMLGSKDNTFSRRQIARWHTTHLRPGRPLRPHARAWNLMRHAETAAMATGAQLRWSVEVVPGVGHDRVGMVGPAADVLFGARKVRRFHPTAAR